MPDRKNPGAGQSRVSENGPVPLPVEGGDQEAVTGEPFSSLPGLTTTRGPNTASNTEFVSIGFGSLVAINRVLAVIGPDSAPVRRFLRDARDRGLLMEATFGRKTKAVILLDSGHVLTAALQPETIISRFENQKKKS